MVAEDLLGWHPAMSPRLALAEILFFFFFFKELKFNRIRHN
jgi:hypothetical protein